MQPTPPPRASPSDELYARLTFAFGVLFLGTTACYFAAAQSFSLTRPPIDFSGFALGRDFLNTWMGGRSAFAGGPASWFDLATYTQALREITGRPDLHGYQWSYPPHLILFIWPLGLLPYLPAYVLWCAIGLGLYLWAAWAGGITRKYMLFLAVAPAVAVNVLGGQNGFLTAALLIGGLANLDRRPILSGILFGILTIKPQFGLLLPLLLIVTGRWRVIAAAAGTTILLVAATALWFGPDIWVEFFRKVMPLQQQSILDAGRNGYAAVSSAFVDARRIGIAVQPAWAIQAAVSAAAVAMVIWTFLRRRDPALAQALFVAAVFLVTPYMLNYDMVVLGFVAARLRQRADNRPLDHGLIIAVWMLPLLMLVFGAVDVPVATPVLLGFTARLAWRLAHARLPGIAADALPVAAFGGRRAHLTAHLATQE